MNPITQIGDIYLYLIRRLTPPCEYEKYLMARNKWLFSPDLLDKDETIAVVCTSSYYATILRSTYREFVHKRSYEPQAYWDAVVKAFIFGSIWETAWKEFFELPQTKQFVAKTTLPRWTPIGITGCSWGILLKMCKTWCKEMDSLEKEATP